MTDLDRFLQEDLGAGGDATTRALFGRRSPTTRARVFARQPLVAAGLAEAVEVFRHLGVRARPALAEGDGARAGATLLDLRGPLGAILSGERLALNFIGRMSGIATLTRRLQVQATRANPGCRVAATRKTTPGFRAYEKRAVAIGGGDPHRYGLHDGILIKDNHLAALGSVRRAVRRAVRGRRGLPVEVEVGRGDQALAAADAGADWILLDNLSPRRGARIARTVRAEHPRVLIESSGDIRPETLAAYARYSDRVSLGRLTHSASAADVSLELAAPKTIKA